MKCSDIREGVSLACIPRAGHKLKMFLDGVSACIPVLELFGIFERKAGGRKHRMLQDGGSACIPVLELVGVCTGKASHKHEELRTRGRPISRVFCCRRPC